jgi:hypothetical protein
MRGEPVGFGWSDQNLLRGDTWAVDRPCLVPPLFIAGVLISTALALSACGSSGSQVSQSDRDKAVDQAQVAFQRAQTSGVDMTPGPCIAENVPGLSDWVVDVAHDPRQDVDDDPANQCQRYRNGDAHHFVELEPNGALIRAE